MRYEVRGIDLGVMFGQLEYFVVRKKETVLEPRGDRVLNRGLPGERTQLTVTILRIGNRPPDVLYAADTDKNPPRCVVVERHSLRVEQTQ